MPSPDDIRLEVILLETDAKIEKKILQYTAKLVNEKIGKAEHILDGSTIVIDKGYHPCVVAPGYEMYYFTICCSSKNYSS